MFARLMMELPHKGKKEIEVVEVVAYLHGMKAYYKKYTRSRWYQGRKDVLKKQWKVERDGFVLTGKDVILVFCFKLE